MTLYALCRASGDVEAVIESASPPLAPPGLSAVAVAGPLLRWPADQQPGMVMRVVGGALAWHDASTPEVRAEAARKRRDAELAASDKTQLFDYPIDASKRAAWAVYRQALRGITEQADFPLQIDWPAPPTT